MQLYSSLLAGKSDAKCKLANALSFKRLAIMALNCHAVSSASHFSVIIREFQVQFTIHK